MIPLWMTVISPVQSRCGWALRSFGPAVRRPARVGEADRGVRRPVGDGGLEVDQLAGPLLDEQVTRVIDQGDAGRVVAAVLEALEPFDQDGPRLPGTGVTDDAAHWGLLSLVPIDGATGRGDIP